MIVVRDVFQLKFGKAKEALSLLKESLELSKKSGYKPDRLLTDLTGQYYTLIMEGTFKNLADYESILSREMGNGDWKQWYQKFTPLVESGRREIFTVVQ